MKKFIYFVLLTTIPISTLQGQVIHSDFLVNNPSENLNGIGRTAISAGANGNFAVAWQDFNIYGFPIPAMPRVAVQLYSSNAAPIGSLNLFNGESRSLFIYDNDYLTGDIDLDFLPNGTLLVAVEHEGQYSTTNSWVFSSEAGIGAVSAEGQIIDLTSQSGVISWLVPIDLIDWGNPRLSVTPSSGFFAIINGPSYNTELSAVLIQAFDVNGNYLGNYFSPHPTDPGPSFNHLFPDIATNGTIHIVVWQDNRNDAQFDITTQFYNNTEPLGGNQKVNSGDPQSTFNILPSVSMNSAGNSIVVWVDNRQSSSSEIFGQRYNSSGQQVGNNFQISAGEEGIYDRPEVAIRNDGSFMVVWTDSLEGIAGIPGLRARTRQFDSDGNPVSAPSILPINDLPSGFANIASDGTYYYCSWLDVRADNVTPNVYVKVIGDIVNSVESPSEEKLPINFQLTQNYPNPFNPSTIIKYSIPSIETHGHASIRLVVYDILGKEIVTLVNEQQKAGFYEVDWNAANNSSGIYFYRIQAGDFVETKKMVLIK